VNKRTAKSSTSGIAIVSMLHGYSRQRSTIGCFLATTGLPILILFIVRHIKVFLFSYLLTTSLHVALVYKYRWTVKVRGENRLLFSG